MQPGSLPDRLPVSRYRFEISLLVPEPRKIATPQLMPRPSRTILRLLAAACLAATGAWLSSCNETSRPESPHASTATWFGVFTHEGETTAIADALQQAWGGGQPANRAPAIHDLVGVAKSAVAAGHSFEAGAAASDPDGDPLIWHWAVIPEQKNGHAAHKQLPMPKSVPGSIAAAEGDRVTVKAPAKPGIYRLHAWVKDGKGHAATANMPFEVR
jgi:hypothetical protein